ncbi:hypothetical protein [Kaistia sp. MMO-174]|uniref:hypothetical protein n=1 Tax=Kaistia sp. MMO-174 TaxID=3081256 RepID=UPI003015FC8F
MIRIEMERQLPPHLAKAKGRNKVAKVLIQTEATIDEAVDYALGVAASADYLPIIEIRLFDFATYCGWVRNGGIAPAPIRVIGRDEFSFAQTQA